MRSAYHKILTDLTALRGLVDFILEKEITIDYYINSFSFYIFRHTPDYTYFNLLTR